MRVQWVNKAGTQPRANFVMQKTKTKQRPMRNRGTFSTCNVTNLWDVMVSPGHRWFLGTHAFERLYLIFPKVCKFPFIYLFFCFYLSILTSKPKYGWHYRLLSPEVHTIDASLWSILFLKPWTFFSSPDWYLSALLTDALRALCRPWLLL